MSASSCKRPRGHSTAAAGDGSSSRPSTSTPAERCLYRGCARPPHMGSRSNKKFCGVIHCDLYMSNLAETRAVASSTSGAVVGQQIDDGYRLTCMVPGCEKRKRRDPTGNGEDFDFCGKKHMLAMVEEMTKEWGRKGRLCKLEGCYRHVHVEEDGRCHDYCGLTHATRAAASKGASKAAKVYPKAIEECGSLHHSDVDQSDLQLEGGKQSHYSFQEGMKVVMESLIDSDKGYHDKISDHELQRLLMGGSGEESCTPVQHGIDIYEFHPWELVKKFGGYRPRYFIQSVAQQREQKRQSQSRKTKEGFCWKQSGPTHGPKRVNETPNGPRQVLETRYMKYMLEKPDKYEDLMHVQAYRMFNLDRQNCKSKKDKGGKKHNCRSKTDKGGEEKGPKNRWKMHEIAIRQQHGEPERYPRNVILIIFQEAQGEPVWPPRASPIGSPSDGVVEDQNNGHDSILRLEGHFTTNDLRNSTGDPSEVTNFQLPNFEDDAGRNNDKLHVNPDVDDSQNPSFHRCQAMNDIARDESAMSPSIGWWDLWRLDSLEDVPLSATIPMELNGGETFTNSPWSWRSF